MIDSGTATRIAEALERISPEDTDGDLSRIANAFDDSQGNTALDFLWNISTQLERIANAMEQRSNAPVVETQQ